MLRCSGTGECVCGWGGWGGVWWGGRGYRYIVHLQELQRYTVHTPLPTPVLLQQHQQLPVDAVSCTGLCGDVCERGIAVLLPPAVPPPPPPVIPTPLTLPSAHCTPCLDASLAVVSALPDAPAFAASPLPHAQAHTQPMLHTVRTQSPTKRRPLQAPCPKPLTPPSPPPPPLVRTLRAVVGMRNVTHAQARTSRPTPPGRRPRRLPHLPRRPASIPPSFDRSSGLLPLLSHFTFSSQAFSDHE